MNTGYIYKLTNYCLVEYIFPDPQITQESISADFTVLTNKYNYDVQFYNDNSNTTNNIQDHTVVQVEGNTYVYIDEEKVPNYLDYDDNFIKSTPLTDEFEYDVVRFHFISGFSFKEFKALIFTIKNLLNNGKHGIFSNILLNENIMQEIVKLNPHPIFLGDAFYDRYFEIIIPAIKKMNQEYYLSPTPESTLAAILSPGLNETETAHNGFIGYVKDAPIQISLSESNTYIPYTPIITTYDTYVINLYKTLSLSQTNDFDGLTAEIHESDEGNYIEYTMLKYGAFPNEFIAYLNAQGPNNNWVIIHQLSVYEQVGSSEIKTSDMMYFQDDNFEQFLKFRPVLEYAENAVTFSVDYLIRLTNQFDGEQIIRRGSATFDNPKAYGKDTRSLSANITAQPYKIYNKIVMKKGLDKTNAYVEPEFDDVPNPPIEKTTDEREYKNIYVPYVINFARVGLSNQSAFNSIVSSNSQIYGQGKYPLIITPMDNFFKFIIHQENIDGVYEPMDLNIGTRYNLVFKSGNKEVPIPSDNTKKKDITPIQKEIPTQQEKIKDNIAISPLSVSTTRSNQSISSSSVLDSLTTSSYVDSSGTIVTSDNVAEIANLKEGELIFRLIKSEARTLYQSPNGEYYVTIVSEEGTETVLYRGFWSKMADTRKDKQKEVITTPSPIDEAKLKPYPIAQPKEPSPLVATGATKSTTYDPETNTVIADNPFVFVPDYIPLYDTNKNISVVNKLTPKSVIEEEESDTSSSTIEN